MLFADIDEIIDGSSNEKPQTNADRIRAMSDEELAKFFDEEFATCSTCRTLHVERCDGRCSEHLLEWLKQPAEGE